MADNKSNMQIAVQYQLPEKWNEETAFSFEHLSDLVEQVHTSAYSASVKAINRFATVRNYVIGYYIVEYKQHGSDRAKYGDKLLKRLAEKVNKRGINETLLKISRAFYLNYPQVKTYLEGKSPTLSHQLNKKSAMPSHQLEKTKTESEKSIEIFPTASGKLGPISPIVSDKFTTEAHKLISQLSFSHLVEIMTVDDPLARFFYETECIKCCWSVKELRRQIATNLYFRAGVSKKPEVLLQRTETNAAPALTKWWNTPSPAWIITYSFPHICFPCRTRRHYRISCCGKHKTNKNNN